MGPLKYRVPQQLCASPCAFFGRRRTVVRASNTIAQFGSTFLLGAVSATKDRVVLLDPMTDDACAALWASRCKGLNGTFETIECVANAIHGYLERLVVIVTARFAFRHRVPLNQEPRLMFVQTPTVVAGSISYLPDGIVCKLSAAIRPS